MLLLLSPAKTLDYATPLKPALLQATTKPQFAAQAAELIATLRRKTPRQVAALMGLSPALAQLNVARYAAWQAEPPADAALARPAVRAFDGDVYSGLRAATLGPAALAWAQQHLVILSGLYGALRPLDALQPYRLEMGTALTTRRGKDLYAWWGDTLAGYLNERQAAEPDPVVVNLASLEYSRAALRSGLKARVVDCVFEDWKGGGWKIISFFTKKARGLMARHAIDKRARTPRSLISFAAEGYAFAADVSQPHRLVFRRKVAT